MIGTTFLYIVAESLLVLAYTADGFQWSVVLVVGAGGSAGGVLAVKFSKRVFHD